MRKVELITVEDQKLTDENNLKLGKKIKDITKINNNKWRVRDSLDGGNFGRKTYRIVETVGDKIHCEIICSRFKWERNRHPNCKHVEAVMNFENKKYKTYIPIEWEILFINSDLKREFMRVNDLTDSISKDQKLLNETRNTIMELEKKIRNLQGENNGQ